MLSRTRQVRDAEAWLIEQMGGTIWVPGRKNSHWMRCPSCTKRTWCAIGWQD